MPLRAGEPLRLIDIHIADSASTGQIGPRRVKPVSLPHKDSCAERCVQLVPGERQVVNPGCCQVNSSVRSQLRTVDGDPRSVPVGCRREFAERKYLTGDVGRAGDGQQRGRPARQLLVQRGNGIRHGRSVRHYPGAISLPGQQVCVVFYIEHNYLAWHRRRQQIERIRGVAGKDHVVVGAGADKTADGFPRPS